MAADRHPGHRQVRILKQRELPAVPGVGVFGKKTARIEDAARVFRVGDAESVRLLRCDVLEDVDQQACLLTRDDREIIAPVEVFYLPAGFPALVHKGQVAVDSCLNPFVGEASQAGKV